MAKSCNTCIYNEHDCLYEPCYSCLLDKKLPNHTEPDRPKPTNLDRLRSMSEEELARFLATTTAKYCSWRDTVTEEAEKWLKWLRQESK